MAGKRIVYILKYRRLQKQTFILNFYMAHFSVHTSTTQIYLPLKLVSLVPLLHLKKFQGRNLWDVRKYTRHSVCGRTHRTGTGAYSY